MSKFNANVTVDSLADAVLEVIESFIPASPLAPQGPSSGVIATALGLTSEDLGLTDPPKVNPWNQVISSLVGGHPVLADYEMVKGPFGGALRKDREKKAAKKGKKGSETPSSPTNEASEESTETLADSESAAAE